MKTDFLLVGVGGQGTILASDIVAELGLAAGHDVKKSEIHGMSQRGGSVDSHVRWGDRVYSPLAAKGDVDFLLSFELLEAARWMDYLAPTGTAIINNHAIPPLSVTRGEMHYPSTQDVVAFCRARGSRVILVEGTRIAAGLGNAAAAGIVLLGVLSSLLPCSREVWAKVIEGRVPKKFVDLNLQAFAAGQDSASAGMPRAK